MTFIINGVPEIIGENEVRTEDIHSPMVFKSGKEFNVKIGVVVFSKNGSASKITVKNLEMVKGKILALLQPMAKECDSPAGLRLRLRGGGGHRLFDDLFFKKPLTDIEITR